MKKTIFFFILFCGTAIIQAKVNIERIEPGNWFVGMKDPTLQLMVYGKDIHAADVKVGDPSVKIDSIVRLKSPDYLLLYLNLEGAKAGNIQLVFTREHDKRIVNYPLFNREKKGEDRVGFTNSDVLYMLMPDRFANGNPGNDQIRGMNAYKTDRSQPSLRHGGDLEGIRKHLDYFNKLGVTALWLTPVLENDSPDEGVHSTYHGYATTNYYRIDPRFGTNEEYKQLVKEAHQHGLKIVMDMIFNHCGFDHPWIKDIPSDDWFNAPEWLQEQKGLKKLNRNPVAGIAFGDTKSAYLQTSYKLTPVLDPYSSKIDLKETVDGWFVPTMPDLNQRNFHVIKYLIQNSIWWIETVGIDGIRMDTYPYADRKAMALWMKTLDNEYPNFNVVGETWVTEPAYTAAWQKGNKLQPTDSYLKTVMDFSFFDKLNKAKNEETDDWWNGLNRIYNSFVYDYLYPNPSSVMAFIENHDTDRFLGKGQDTLALKQALALLLTINRIPQLYYGTEILMNGTKEVTDGNVRKDFPGGFPNDDKNAFLREDRTKEQNEMFDWLSKLLHWRQGNEIINKGSQTQFIPYRGVYVIARQYNGKAVMTILNGTSKPSALYVGRYKEIIGNKTHAKDVMTDRQIDLTNNIELAPRQTIIVEM